MRTCRQDVPNLNCGRDPDCGRDWWPYEGILASERNRRLPEKQSMVMSEDYQLKCNDFLLAVGSQLQGFQPGNAESQVEICSYV